MSLLDEAIKQKTTRRVSLPTNDETIELAIAYFVGMVGLAQAASALGYTDRHTRANTHNRLITVLRNAVRDGKVTIEKVQ